MLESNVPSTKDPKLQAVIDLARKWLLSARTFWAPTIKGDEPRIANTVEGLFCFLHERKDHLNEMELRAVNSAVHFLMQSTTPQGLPSVTLGKCTVHCTAMGLFVLKKLQSAGIVEFGKEQEERLEWLKQALIGCAGKYGWGFTTDSRPEQQGHVRLFSTLWALRALAQTELITDKVFKDVLLDMTMADPRQMFGYVYGDAPKMSIVALYVTLLHEIPDPALIKSIRSHCQMQDLLSFLIAGLTKDRFSEVEEFLCEIDAAEKLSWAHISGALAIQALSLAGDDLSREQETQIWQAVCRIVVSCRSRGDGYFFDEGLVFEKINPKMFPTAYYYVALSSFQHHLSKKAGNGSKLRNQVFFCYTHKDRKWLEELQLWLKPIMPSDVLWDDTKIATGSKWKEEIQKSLASARVAVLLVSQDFLASDFIKEHELPPLLKAEQEEGLTILWIPVSHSTYEHTEIAQYQAAHTPARPLNSLKGASLDKALVAICKKIKAAAAQA